MSPTNRLRDETSPYLRQHANNPVDWYPWGDEAFEKARAEDKPLFISIGYASCHWCHVMAHESFEDEEIAAALAQSFVAVKVDREERPDIDTIYMAATQALTGSGGWPMSVFCTSDGRPFFAGTYFPPTERHGMPSFRRVLEALSEAWTEHRAQVDEQADALVDAVAKEVRLADELTVAAGDDDENGDVSYDQLLEAVVAQLTKGFDATWGGFGPAPKFPRPSLTDLALRHHLATGAVDSARMALVTLDAMAAGGIYDHLVGGFCRYSTDGRWLVPHFEKMLTDQALLARTYLHAWQVTGDDRYQQVLTETLDYVLDALRTPDGALFSSEDADAAGVEGGHATLTKAHIQEILGAAGRSDLIDVTCAWYGITEAGNWEGTNVLHRPVGAPLARSDDIEAARLLLLEHRRSRPQPALDDKVLTEWNAMAVTALAEAACATGNARWGQGAEEIAEFLFAQLRQPNGRWLRSWQGGRARHLALAADYAWVVQACLAVAAWSGKAIWSTRAGEVADQMLELFWDNEAGGLFTTGNDAEALIVRPKEFVDGAVPSTNSIGADALFRVGALRADERFADAARAIVGLGQPLLARHASALADLVSSIQLAEAGAEVVVTGDRPDLVDEVRRHWLPAAVVAFGQAEDTDLWRDRAPNLAYVCHHFTCQAPTDQTDTLRQQLSQLPGVRRPDQTYGADRGE